MFLLEETVTEQSIRIPAHPKMLHSMSLLIIAGLFLSFTVACQSPPKAGHQRMIHQMGAQVMPFDLSKTRHIFEMTETGGIQRVIVRDPKDADQIPLIRQHLQHEAMRFANGNFADPMALHGMDMPGISALSAGASKIQIRYAEVPSGAELTFETSDIHLITAIHQWFGAQLSDHGADASYR